MEAEACTESRIEGYAEGTRKACSSQLGGNKEEKLVPGVGVEPCVPIGRITHRGMILES
jgi:hypothetical protein